MKKTYFIFLILCIGLLILGIVFTGAIIGLYLNFPAIVIVVLLPSFAVIGAFGFSTFLRSFRLAFAGTNATVKQLKTGVALFAAFGRCLLLTGVITSMIGLIGMLGDLREAHELGRAIAISLVTLFYALILIFIVTIPFKAAHERRLLELNGGEA